MLKELSEIIEKPLKIKRRIIQTCLELEEIRRTASSVQGVSYNAARVTTSHGQSRTEQYIIKSERMQNKIQELMREELEAIDACKQLIYSADLDRDERSILIRRYIGCMRYPDIAESMGTCEKSMYLKRRSGIEKLEKIITRDAAGKEGAGNTADQ